MKEEIKVSIIVPVYNAEDNLKRTVDALCAQTLEEIQIILVNDGSVDQSGRICDEYAVKDKKVICIHKQNGGVSAARNDGIQAAEGEYLMFCDADDIPDVKQAELLYQRAIEEQADVVLCGFIKEKAGEQIEEVFPYKYTMNSKNEILDKLIMPMCVWGYTPNGQGRKSIYGGVWRGLYKKSICEDKKIPIEFPEEIRFGEDMIFNAKCWWKAHRIAFIQEPLYLYVENENSATHTNSELLWNRYQMVWEKMYQTLQTFDCEERYFQWQCYQLTRYAVSAIIEGVCSQKTGLIKKLQLMKGILSNRKLKLARKNMPTDLGKKEKALVWALRPVMTVPVLFYYQRIYDKEYRR